MDTLTQGLLGAVTAQLGFRQRIGRTATWVAAGAAIVPDLDILIPLVQPLLSVTGSEPGDLGTMGTHRGLSHSLLVVPILALAIAFSWRWVRRGAVRLPGSCDQENSPSFRLLFGCVFIAVLSHPLLDWCTSYGTQLFAPITSHRYAIDAVPIIDIIYTPILVMTLLSCYVVRKLKSDSRNATLKIGWVGFALSIAYLAAGYAMNTKAVISMRRLSSERVAEPAHGPFVAEYRAYPQPGTIFVWRTIRRSSDRWTAARINVLFKTAPERIAWSEAIIVENDWVRRARELPAIKRFDWFAMGQIRAAYKRQAGMHFVEFHDMRYGLRPESVKSLWSLRVVFADSGRLVTIERILHHRNRGLRETIGESWRDIWNP